MSEPMGAQAVRQAALPDLDELLKLEQASFDSDRLSRRSFKHHIQSDSSDLLVVMEKDGVCLAYGLVLYHRGTRLARLYSLAVAKQARGLGLAKQILAALEQYAAGNEKHYMRLEVAKHNLSAIRLYESCGYRVFGEYTDYYEDHGDALRMHKRIRELRAQGILRKVTWCQQTTEFTCGPAALMMAMSSLEESVTFSIELELDIWREATTIFMTSGHGGCHPFGLALAAKKRGFDSAIWINTYQTLFVDGVRSEHKKQILTRVHHHFLQQCLDQQIRIHYKPMTLDKIHTCLSQGKAVLILVSTFRLDGKKAPHWVMVAGADDDCLFVQDPDPDENSQTPMDCQYVPIAKEDFDKMAAFGAQRIRCAVVLQKRKQNRNR